MQYQVQRREDGKWIEVATKPNEFAARLWVRKHKDDGEQYRVCPESVPGAWVGKAVW